MKLNIMKSSKTRYLWLWCVNLTSCHDVDIIRVMTMNSTVGLTQVLSGWEEIHYMNCFSVANSNIAKPFHCLISDQCPSGEKACLMLCCAEEAGLLFVKSTILYNLNHLNQLLYIWLLNSLFLSLCFSKTNPAVFSSLIVFRQGLLIRP